MMLRLKNIDVLRNQPKEQWHVLYGALPVYHLFHIVQLIPGRGGPTLVRVYPKAADPNDSYSRIDFYQLSDADVLNAASERDRLTIQERMEGFASVIEAEDYVAAASSHLDALSGAQEYVTFGRNEPALHHYHNSYNEVLGLPPLEVVGNP